MKLYNGDCLEIMKTFESESVDCILTDPPYGIDFKSNMQDHQKRITNDDFTNWKKNLSFWLKEFKRIISPNGVVCCFNSGGGKLPVSAIFTLEAVKYFHLIQTLIWKKTIGLGWRYRPAYETIIILSKSKDNYNFYDTSKKCSNVIMGINQKIPQKGEHPTVKPVSLMKHLLEIHSCTNDIVLDPFMGSGTTGVACKNLNRDFIGIELDKEYFELAKKRIASTEKGLF